MTNPASLSGAYAEDRFSVYLYNLSHAPLRANQIDDDAVRKLSKLHKLKLLDLSNTLADDGAIPALAQLNLQELRMTGTGITDSGLNRLAGMKHLTALSIQNCRHITPQAIERFREDRPDCNLSVSKQRSR